MTDLQIRLDRSRPHSTCHGDRTPEDPMYRVHFWQGGTIVHNGKKHIVLLPFDAHGELVQDDGRTESIPGIDSEGKKVDFKPLYTPLMRLFIEAKKKKAQVTNAVASATGAVIEEAGEKDEAENGLAEAEDEVNLEAWLRGQIQYSAGTIRDAYARRYHKRTDKIRDIVIDLVLDEKLIPENEVCAALAAKLPEKAAA